MFQAGALEGSKSQQYAELASQALGLLTGERDRIANAANLSALVFHALPDLSLAGHVAAIATFGETVQGLVRYDVRVEEGRVLVGPEKPGS